KFEVLTIQFPTQKRSCMKMRVSTWGQVSSGLLVSMLAACGGGGGGGYGSMTLVPTAAGNYPYTLSCTGAGGTKSGSVWVTVTPNPLTALAPATGTAIATV